MEPIQESYEQTWQRLSEAAELEVHVDNFDQERLEMSQRGGAALFAAMKRGENDDMIVYRSID